MSLVYAIGFFGFTVITLAGLLAFVFAWAQIASQSPIIKVMWAASLLLTIVAGGSFYYSGKQKAEQASANLAPDLAAEIQKEARQEASQSIFYALGLVGLSLASTAVARSLRSRH